MQGRVSLGLRIALLQAARNTGFLALGCPHSEKVDVGKFIKLSIPAARLMSSSNVCGETYPV